MTLSGKSILAVFAGLSVGWASRDVVTTEEGARPSSQPKPVSGRPASKTGTHPVVTATHDLSDVSACRKLLENSEYPDARHPLLRETDRSLALRRWLELDPDSALKEAERDPDSGFATDLFREWIELDPSSALAALDKANRALTREVARDFFVTLMAKDPAMAADALQSPKWRDGKEDTLGWDFHQYAYQAWMRADPAAAIAWLDHPPSSDSTNICYGMAAAWAETDFKAAWLHFFPEASADTALSDHKATTMMAKGLLAGSPDALRILETLAAEPKRFGHMVLDRREDIAAEMASSNPAAALDWANSRPADDPLRLRILANLADPLASSDPEQALALLKESGGSTRDWENEGVLRDAYAALAETDPQRTAERIGELPATQQKDAIAGYLTHIFLSDPSTAMNQTRIWLMDPQTKDAVAKGWAKAFSWGHGAGARDPSGMLEAIPELNEAVDENVLSTWSKADPEGAAAWISGRLEEGHKIPFGNEGILAELAISKPEFTASWLLTLRDPEISKEAAGTLTANWGAFDPEATRQWIDSLPAGKIREAAEAGMKRIREGR